MIIYTRSNNKVIARFGEDWIYSISNLFAKRGISEREFIKNYLNNRSKFVGIATCHEDDTFDLAYGKELARQRLLQNYDNTVKIIAKLLRDYLNEKNSAQNEAIKNVLDY